MNTRLLARAERTRAHGVLKAIRLGGMGVVAAAVVATSGCQSPPRTVADDEWQAPKGGAVMDRDDRRNGAGEPSAGTGADPAQPPEPVLEDRLYNLVERQEALLEQAAQTESAMEWAEIAHGIREVTRVYEEIIAENPDATEPMLLYGKLLRQIGEPERAQEIFRMANAVDPQIPVVKQQMGNYFAEAEEHPRALLYYLAAIELAPEEAVYHYTMGEFLHVFRDDFIEDEAYDRETLDTLMLNAFREAAKLEPANLDFQFRYAETYYDLERIPWDEALAVWERIATMPLTVVETDAVRLHRARALLNLGRTREAEAMASAVQTPGLEATRDALLARISTALE